MSVQVTPEKLRAAASAAELRGDWDQVELFNAAADRLISLESQNQAYRHALSAGVSISLVAKKRWFKQN
jgi:hypothetical protein